MPTFTTDKPTMGARKRFADFKAGTGAYAPGAVAERKAKAARRRGVTRAVKP